MAFSLKATIKSFGFQWILVGTWMNKMGDNISYLAQLYTTNLASSPVWIMWLDLVPCTFHPQEMYFLRLALNSNFRNWIKVKLIPNVNMFLMFHLIRSKSSCVLFNWKWQQQFQLEISLFSRVIFFKD